ncbi:hypothetical protein HMPREF1624_06878 [Sporothrix schenckii ATCC 58251]|uniref:WLM domain-containing protein n=1 Tax=Sporothrix schenckii (strain ATCC 58251 / de Perez 2211183) TaxID=1391915 RepID=U7PPJ5_SPOS1|nr:hypothetical protein HMPREF1624_06878 [Sporothrix schenckii ATCC 58251]
MPEHDPVVLAYSHLRDFPRAADALQLLRRVASLVKPLMRARRWKVRELSEFFPDQANLLGLNINKGQKILLRLRYPGDASLFLPLEQVADTLLHELAHIVHGPHDAVFHALWNQLRDEHMALALKGFTGEGFLSEGHRLGGDFDNSGRNNWGATGITSSGPSSAASNTLKRPISMDEARRLARAAAERRQAKAAEKERQSRQPSSGSKTTGHRLGGSASSPANDMRSVIADAVARRNSHTPETMRGCATDGPQSEYTDQTRKWLADQAARNGFRTQAEEDAANDAAIAQALWELVQEDERQRLGDRYVPPTAERPEGNGGWLSSSNGDRSQGASSASPIVIDGDVMHVDPPRGPPPQHRRPAPPPPTTRPRPTSMSAVPPGTATRRAPPSPGPKPAELSSSSGARPRSSSSGATSSNASRGWTCSICTLHNPGTYLVCDACGVERTSSSSPPKNAGKDGQPSSHRSSHSHAHSNTPTSLHPPPPPPLAHRPAPPPPTSGSVPLVPRRSPAAQNAAAAASARASAMRQSGQPAKKPRVKKQVRFTPSTRGGSVSYMTSTSSRARPRSPPPATLTSGVDSVVSNGSSSNGGSTFDKILAKHRPAPPPNQPPRPAPASSSIASSSNSAPSSSSPAPASATWMCTMCWANMGHKHTTCGSCGKPREAWQN